MGGWGTRNPSLEQIVKLIQNIGPTGPYTCKTKNDNIGDQSKDTHCCEHDQTLVLYTSKRTLTITCRNL